MKPLLALVFLALTPLGVMAQTTDDADETPPETSVMRPDEVDLQQFIWKKRPVIVLADSPNDPRFIQQMSFLEAEIDDLAKRDVVILTDTDPEARSPLREKLHPRGFMLVLIGKDGGIKLRKPLPWDVRELSRAIDKMPMRQQEIQDRRGLN
ncbi:MAG: DUF4174 domain-containing protein [Roseovarius sp.]